MTRRWYQFRLSTALTLMIVASGLLWMNLRERKVSLQPIPRDISRGWPLAWHVHRPAQEIHFDQATGFIREQNFVHWKAVGINSAAAIGILFALGLALEWSARRRDKSA